MGNVAVRDVVSFVVRRKNPFFGLRNALFDSSIAQNRLRFGNERPNHPGPTSTFHFIPPWRCESGCAFIRFFVICLGIGEGGIRTLGTLLEYGALAKRCFRPLSHLTNWPENMG